MIKQRIMLLANSTNTEVAYDFVGHFRQTKTVNKLSRNAMVTGHKNNIHVIMC